jgi:hypothetical protein
MIELLQQEDCELLSEATVSMLVLPDRTLIQKQVVDLRRDPSLLRASSMPCVDTAQLSSFRLG